MPSSCAVGPFPLENHLSLVPQDLKLLIRAFLPNAHQASIFGAYKLVTQKLIFFGMFGNWINVPFDVEDSRSSFDNFVQT